MINEKGQEVLDKTPVELPIGYKHPLPLDERMKMLIKDELSEFADSKGYETWEEANDFDIGEGEDDGLYTDEDDQTTPNDPFLQNAYQEEMKKQAISAQKKALEADKKASNLKDEKAQ